MHAIAMWNVAMWVVVCRMNSNCGSMHRVQLAVCFGSHCVAHHMGCSLLQRVCCWDETGVLVAGTSTRQPTRGGLQARS